MVDFVARLLHTMRQPVEQVLDIVTEYAVHVIEPRRRCAGVAGDDRWRSVEVEAFDATVLDPSALRNQPIVDDHRLARGPGYLLDRQIAIKPCAGGNTLVIGWRFAIHPNKTNARVDAARRPHLARWNEEIRVRRHVRTEVLERNFLRGVPIAGRSSNVIVWWSW